MQENQVHLRDVKSSFWDYAALVFSKAGVVLLALASVPLVTRLMGTEDYGRFSVFLMAAQFMLFAFVSWTSGAVIRYGKEEFVKDGKINKVFWARSLILGICFVIGLAVLLIFKDWLGRYIGAPNWIAWFLAGYFLIYALSEFLFYIFQSVGRLKTMALTEFAESVILLVSLLTVKFFIGYSLPILATVVAAYIFCKISADLFFVSRLDLKIFLPVEIDSFALKRILNFSYPLIFGIMAGYAATWLDLAIIKRHLDLSQVGLYALAFKLANFSQYIGGILNVVLAPIIVGFLAAGNPELIIRYIRRIIPQLMFLWLIIVFFIFILGRPLLPVLFGQSFGGSVLPFSILILAYLMNILVILYNPVFTAYEMVKRGTILNVFIAAFGLGLAFVLIPRMGINGAAWAKVFAFSFSGAAYLFLGNRRLKITDFRPFSIFLPLIFLFIAVYFLPGPAGVILGVSAFLISGFAVAKIIDLFRPEDKAIFDKIDMPVFARRFLYKIIDVLSPAL